MRDLSSLGISPWPWSVGKTETSRIYNRNDFAIATCKDFCLNRNLEDSNARLMKTSPKLYEALYDACSRRCLYCKLREADGSCNQPESDCVVQQWKSVLAEAAGEEVK